MAAHDHVWDSAKNIVARAHFLARSEIDGLRKRIILARPREEIAASGHALASDHLEGLAAVADKLNSRPEYDVARLDLRDYCNGASCALAPLVSAYETADAAGFPAARAALVDWLKAAKVDLSSKATALDDAADTLPVP